MRDNGLRVNDEPKFMVDQPTDEHHAIVIPATDSTDQLLIPLSLAGVTSYFPVRKPTKKEYDNAPEFRVIELTSETCEWNPTDDFFAEQERAMLDTDFRVRDHTSTTKSRKLCSITYDPIEQKHCDTYAFGRAIEGTRTFNIRSV